MPVTSSFTSLSGVFRKSLTSEGMPEASRMALLFSSFCRPYDKFLKRRVLVLKARQQGKKEGVVMREGRERRERRGEIQEILGG